MGISVCSMQVRGIDLSCVLCEQEDSDVYIQATVVSCTWKGWETANLIATKVSVFNPLCYHTCKLDFGVLWMANCG
jgi:hypothetical protein